MPHSFKRGAIRECTDPNSYDRGRRYFEQGRVHELEVEHVDSDVIVLHGAVLGRHAVPYQQEVTVAGLRDGVIEIDGLCSCPVGFNCKHVVAVCLAYQAMAGSASDAGTDASGALSWLDRFIRAGQEQATIPGKEFLVYLLKPAPRQAGLVVEYLVTRHLKKGGLGKGRRTELYNFSAPFLPPDYALPVDQEIGRLLEAQDTSIWGSSTVMLDGELGFLALSKMVQSGRCFWQDTSGPPLQRGKPRRLLPSWQAGRDGRRRLELHLEPAAMPLNTMPALYLDIAAGEVGPIEGADFTAEQWSLLLAAPVEVPAEASAEFTYKLLTHLPDRPLPPPASMEQVRLEPQPPVPRLYLFGEEDPHSGRREHMIRLRFAYVGYELSPAAPGEWHRQIDGDRIIEIPRDPAAEDMAAQVLSEAGFRPLQRDGEVYWFSPPEPGPMDAVARWQRFLDEILPELQARGWEMRFDPGFALRFVQGEAWQVAVESDNDWFDLHFDLEVEGRKLPLLPIIADVLARYDPDTLPEILTLPLGESEYLQLPAEHIRPVCQTLYELYDAEALDDDGHLRLGRFDAVRLAELEDNLDGGLRWRGGKDLRELGRKLKDFKGIKPVAPPRGLKAELRDYQQQGLNWLQFLRAYGFNGILADDMGLGKTVQTLAHLALEKERGRMKNPCLIVAPTSLVGNWRREAAQFTPRLKVLVLHGPDRKVHFDALHAYDLIISTYPLLVRDEEVLASQSYHYLVLDEAQVIKNPRAKVARVVRRLQAEHRLCLTGTPMENHLGELWALFDFLMPGFLGDHKLFKQRFRTPIEVHGDREQRARLVRRVTPFLLRRTKGEVIAELPAKTEIVRSVALPAKQAALYESIRLSMEKKVRDAIAKKGLARSHITILDALLKLRQACCDPRLLSLPQAKKVHDSAKLELLMQMLPELLEEGRRVLLFSQFTKMLGIIEEKLHEAGITYCKLTGQTRKRDEVIERFRAGKAEVFLISLKAGGVGLNLTEADTVIHYDPWWNPAVENQATDRAHRIGQDKAVFVYKLITENTLEEKIMAMQAGKQALAEGIYKQRGDGEQINLDADELQELFAPLSS